MKGRMRSCIKLVDYIHSTAMAFCRRSGKIDLWIDRCAAASFQNVGVTAPVRYLEDYDSK
jgi:hypothetical protein